MTCFQKIQLEECNRYSTLDIEVGSQFATLTKVYVCRCKIHKLYSKNPELNVFEPFMLNLSMIQVEFGNSQKWVFPQRGDTQILSHIQKSLDPSGHARQTLTLAEPSQSQLNT